MKDKKICFLIHVTLVTDNITLWVLVTGKVKAVCVFKGKQATFFPIIWNWNLLYSDQLVWWGSLSLNKHQVTYQTAQAVRTGFVWRTASKQNNSFLYKANSTWIVSHEENCLLWHCSHQRGLFSFTGPVLELFFTGFISCRRLTQRSI